MKLEHPYKFCLALIFFSMLASCKKEFLDRNPLSQPSSGTFWKNEDDVKLALAGVYNTLTRNLQGFGAQLMYWDGLSDNAWPKGNEFTPITQGQIESTTGGIVGNAYNINYRNIATVNYFLANIGQAKLDQAKQNQYTAEVRFLRAYFYFQLSEIYGGVPITLQPESFETPNRAKKTKEEVVKVILDDLDFAIANLPDVAYAGRAVKGSALGLKARVLLFNNRLQEAAAAAKAIIDSKKFSISNSYYGLFVKPGQNSNPEIMFSIRFLLPNMSHTLDYQYGWDQWERIQPIKSLADAYEMKDGQPAGQSPLYNPANPYANRDARLKLTIYTPGDPWKYSPTGMFDPAKDGNNQTGFNFKKYLDTTRAPAGYATLSDQDIIILRYADVLLMYAEAQNELSGPDQSVYDAVNAVRTRASINMPTLPAGLTKDQMRDRIRNERRVELALEGLRYFDLKRLNIAHVVLPQIINPGGVARKFEQKHYLWPFPQSEIDINRELVQNTGY